MRLLLAIAALLWASVSFAQLTCGLGDYQGRHLIGCEHGLQGTGEDQFSFVPPPANFTPGEPRDATISVIYNGFTPTAQAAFQYAVDIWASQLNSSVPIIVEATFEPLSGSTLGFAGSDGLYRNFTGAPESNTFYASALANRLNGGDIDPTSADIFCSFNSNSNWYYGTDGNTPGGQYDFVTVVLHELCHGIGFFGSASVTGSNGFITFGGDPVIYDTFVETGGGTPILNFSSGSVALGNALTGNDLFWDGPQALLNNGGIRPRIFAPGTWNGGSSYSHLNESTYGSGSNNALMTPFIGTAEAHHDPGPIVLGILTDIGWEVGGCSILSVTPGTQTSCNGPTNTYNQQLIIEYENEPQPSLLVVNGSLYTVTGSPQTISLNGLPADGQPVDITVSFNAEPACVFTANGLFTAPEPCCGNVRITSVNNDQSQFTLTNYGSCTVDVSAYETCSNLFCGEVGTFQVISGSTNLASGASVTLLWPAWSPAPGGADLSLFSANPDVTDPNDLLDFVQWGSSGNGYEALAVTAGIWGAGDFVGNISPYSYIGDGNQNGVAFWEGTTPPCAIDAIVALSQTGCDPFTNAYDQTLELSFTTPPGTGDLVVNGQNFAYTGNPMTVILTGLDSDGLPVDVFAFFSDQPGCNTTSSAVFTAPANCFCPTDLDGTGFTDISDFLLFLADFGCTGSCSGDLNNDGQTSSDDLLAFLSGFNAPCP
jgi:hypothetical protein